MYFTFSYLLQSIWVSRSAETSRLISEANKQSGSEGTWTYTKLKGGWHCGSTGAPD